VATDHIQAVHLRKLMDKPGFRAVHYMPEFVSKTASAGNCCDVDEYVSVQNY
jgi:hypothetical protein